MKAAKLTKKQARQFILLKQGLLGKYIFIKESGVCDYIKQAGCIQFDPIDVCGKNAELVLQSRVKGFTKAMLDKLLYKDRKLIDYFDKNMSILSMDDWKYFSHKRASYLQDGRSKDKVDGVTDYITSIIKEKGFVSSKDINLKEKVDWSWNPTTLSRAALETMYFRGDIIIHHKKGTIKHYALASDHISDNILKAIDPCQTPETHMEWNVLRRIGAVGILWNKPSDAWLGIDDFNASIRNKVFQNLLRQEKLIEIIIENTSDIFYCLSQDTPILDMILSNKVFTSRTEFIAPLDNMLWDRKLIKAIFDFEYKWEIYTPIIDRKYGYYVLPVLSGDCFIGRIEIVKDKSLNQLLVKNFWFEADIPNHHSFNKDLHACLERFSKFNNCENIKLECKIGEY